MNKKILCLLLSSLLIAFAFNVQGQKPDGANRIQDVHVILDGESVVVTEIPKGNSSLYVIKIPGKVICELVAHYRTVNVNLNGETTSGFPWVIHPDSFEFSGNGVLEESFTFQIRVLCWNITETVFVSGRYETEPGATGGNIDEVSATVGPFEEYAPDESGGIDNLEGDSSNQKFSKLTVSLIAGAAVFTLILVSAIVIFVWFKKKTVILLPE